MNARFYCNYCEKQIDETHVYLGEDGDLHCDQCDHAIEEDVDVCDICGERLYKGDGVLVCNDCLKKYADYEHLVEMLKYINDEEEVKKVLNIFLCKEWIYGTLFKAIKEFFTTDIGFVKDAAIENLIKFYKKDELQISEFIQTWEAGEHLDE